MNWFLLANSLMVAGLTTILSGIFGFFSGIAIAGLPNHVRGWLIVALIAALALPPFLVTNCWLDLLGQNGAWRSWFPMRIYSLPGAVVLLTLMMWPMVALFVAGAMTSLESAQLEVDPALRGGALLRWSIWPTVRVATTQAMVIVFVLALNNFSVPVILQVPVFPEELWLAFTTRLDEAGAWAAAWPLIVAPLFLLILLNRSELSWPRLDGTCPNVALRRQLGRSWVLVSVAGLTLLIFFSLGIPLQRLLFSTRTWTEIPNLLRAVPDVIWNSILFAGAAATASLSIGLVTWRWRLGPIVWLLFLIPGILLGRLLVSGLNKTVIYATATMVILAFTLRHLALGWAGAAFARRSVDRDLIDAGRIDGAAGFALLRHVIWPHIAPRIAAAWYVIYLLCLWDVETMILFQPPGGETLAVRIFNLLHYGHNAQVNALCVILLAVAAAPGLLWIAWLYARTRCQHWFRNHG